MGIKEVRKEIIDNARKEAKSIINEAEKQKKAILKNVDSKLDSVKERLDREAKKKVDQYETMELADAKAQVKKKRLMLERDLIEEVFDQVTQSLEKTDKKKRASHAKKIIKNADFKYSTVYCADKDKAQLKKYKPKTIDVLGGVVLENKAGDIRIDLSYDVMLKTIKEDNLSDIAKLLF